MCVCVCLRVCVCVCFRFHASWARLSWRGVGHPWCLLGSRCLATSRTSRRRPPGDLSPEGSSLASNHRYGKGECVERVWGWMFRCCSLCSRDCEKLDFCLYSWSKLPFKVPSFMSWAPLEVATLGAGKSVQSALFYLLKYWYLGLPSGSPGRALLYQRF